MPLAGSAMPLAHANMLARWIDEGVPGCQSSADDTEPPIFAGAETAAPLPNAIRLGWSAASDNVSAAAAIVYVIYQANQGGAQSFATPTYVTASGATSYTVDGLPLSATRYFVVRARDEAGNIDENQVEVSATTPNVGDEDPPTFGGIKSASASGSSALSLSWVAATDNVSGPEGILYRVYVSQNAGAQNFAVPTLSTAKGALTALVTGLAASTTYHIVVRAEDGAGNEESNTIELAGTTGAPVTLSAGVQPLFTANCTNAGCHGRVNPKEGLDLRAGKSYSDLVGVPSAQCSNRMRVSAGNSAASYLVDKLTGTSLCSGSKMPKSGSLSPAEIQTVIDWIDLGAPNN
jgi:chitinase